ncbi:polysaccharide deacetylase family protein [Ectobacillus ponti]|uniref:Polysaccharide deacetylase family protein n=1 Tax=Ectobacillus ponti TaxID=2961894 RepID=A0AA41X767_9BACI|nr:polysaccharide deacetylase family protein [Ectobacillus ponti]MCP8969982.1 polysaccharide deacetylase family protein [Ectobacillus ponti]
MKKQLRAGIVSFVLVMLCLFATGRTYGQGPTAADLNITGNGVVVLNYHLVLDQAQDRRRVKALAGDPQLTTYNIFLKDFKDHIAVLRKQGVRFITPDQLQGYMTAGKALPAGKCVLLTFDDVDVSVYNNVYPFARKERIPFTVFVVTGQAGNPNYQGLDLADWKEIREMKGSGLVSVGAHTNNMHYFDPQTGEPPFLNPANLSAFQTDIQQSILTYRRNLGVKPTLFAYPYGFGTPDTDEALMSAGFQMLFSLRPGVVHREPKDRTFFIKRVMVTYDTWDAVAEWAAAK